MYEIEIKALKKFLRTSEKNAEFVYIVLMHLKDVLKSNPKKPLELFHFLLGEEVKSRKTK